MQLLFYLVFVNEWFNADFESNNWFGHIKVFKNRWMNNTDPSDLLVLVEDGGSLAWDACWAIFANKLQLV